MAPRSVPPRDSQTQCGGFETGEARRVIARAHRGRPQWLSGSAPQPRSPNSPTPRCTVHSSASASQPGNTKAEDAEPNGGSASLRPSAAWLRQPMQNVDAPAMARRRTSPALRALGARGAMKAPRGVFCDMNTRPARPPHLPGGGSGGWACPHVATCTRPASQQRAQGDAHKAPCWLSHPRAAQRPHIFIRRMQRHERGRRKPSKLPAARGAGVARQKITG